MIPRCATLPIDSEDRKATPLAEGLLFYFPAALAAVARVSKLGNDKHNPGESIHHSRGKSTDHADCILRHLIDMREAGYAPDGVPEVAYLAWRALALAQEWLEEHEGAPLAPNAREAAQHLVIGKPEQGSVVLGSSGTSWLGEDLHDPADRGFSEGDAVRDARGRFGDGILAHPAGPGHWSVAWSDGTRTRHPETALEPAETGASPAASASDVGQDPPGGAGV